MALNCQVVRNQTTNQIEYVTAPNGKRSNLFNSIKEAHPGITDERALRQYARFYTSEFRKSWGDFVALSEGKIKKLEPRINNELAYTVQIELDENYEPVYDDPMLKFMQNYAMGLESKGIDSVNRMDEELSLGAQKHAEYNEKLRAALIDFLKGLNIDVNENADNILDNLYDDNNPIAAFDMINKYLGLHSTIDTGRFTLQVAAIVYEMLGKKTKLSIDIFKNIDKWDAYQTLYDYYNSKEFDNFRDDKNPIGDAEDLGVEYEKEGELVRLALQVYEVGPIANNLIWSSAKKTIKNLIFKDKPFNYWAHKQVIYHFIAEALEYGYQTEYKGPKIKNETINKDYFEKFGWKESPRFVKNIFKKIWNWFYNKIIMQGLLGNIPFAKVSQQDLYDMANSIADDVYKKDYSNIMQQAFNINGEFYNVQGERLEQKFYEETLESDPFAAQIIATLFGLEGFGFTEEKGKQLQSLYKLSGSQVIRRYGFLLRSMSESLHDIDGIIPLEVFEAEENKQEILDFLEGPGLKLENKRKGPKFAKEFEKLLNKQSWYQKVKQVFPDFVYKNAFMGNAKKTQDYVTITGYIEHPTEMEVDKDTGLPRKKRYVLDFFLRTKLGNYPQRFDDTYYSWKQIYEAKIRMGRAKDMNDYILFIPYVTEGTKYVFRNRGFRLMTFEPIAADLQAMIKKSSKNEGVQILNSKSKFSKGVNPEQASDVLDKKNRLLSLNQVKALVSQVGRDITDENFITAEQATEMTKYSENPWSGQAAFYFNDQIYFVDNNITAKTAVHEISHPLIRSIKENNPSLYNNLVQELLSTKEGRDLVEEIMIEQEEGRNPNNPVDMEWAALEIPKSDIPDIVLEEAMVRVLNEKYFMDDAQLTPDFNRFIKKIWFYIKQLLRKIFKTDVSKLSPKTTVEELAFMLKKGNKFDAPVTSVGMEDIVAYSDDLAQYADTITKAYRNDKNKLQESIDKHYNAIQKQLNFLNSLKKSDPELYEQIIAPMANPHNRNYLHEMAISIRPWTSSKLVRAQDDGKITKSELEIFRAKTKALLDTLLQLRELTDQSLKHLKLLAKNPDTASTITKVMEYKKFQQFWSEYIDQAIEDLKSAFANETISNTNPTIQILFTAQNNIKDMKSVIQQINAEYIGDYVADFMEPMNQMANEQYEKRKKEYEERIKENPENAKYYEEAIKREKQLRDRRIVNPDKVKLLLAGALTEDVNGIFDRWVTNFIGQSDPIVGTLAATLKNARNTIHSQALKDKNEFMQEINPYLKELGISGARYQTLADKLLFNDNIGYVNEYGNYEDYEARTLLNPHIGAKAYILKLQIEEKKAKEAWYATKNPNTEKAYLDAIKKKEQVTSLFFNRKYVDEIYDLQKELMDVTREVNGKIENVGLMAYEKTQEILDEIAQLTPALPDPFKTHQNYERIDALWNEYSKLFSFKDDFGRDKDDLNMAIAEVLVENREKNKNYYEYNPIPGAFATAYNSVKSKVILEMTEEGFDQKAKPEEFHEELNERMQMWVDLNTRQIPKESWYTDRARILQIIQQVFEDLAKQRADVLAEDPTLASEFETSNELALIVKEINKNLTGRRDDDGHPKGDDMTEEQLAEIKRLHELKESSKAAVMNLMGLTGEEMERMQEYWDILRRRKKKERDFNGKLVGLTEFEQEDYDFLKTKSDKLGISKIQKNKLFKALQELDDMQERLPTKYYTDIAENWYQRLIRPVLIKTLEGKKVATSVQEEDFLDPAFIDQFLEMDEEFKEWFESSHYETTVYQKGSAPQRMYARIDAWNIVRPSDPKDYESIKIYDEYSEKDITIVGQPGKQFWRREVKPEFWTGYDPNTGEIELKVGEHIDNRGFFMPKSLEAMEAKYQKDPDQFTEDMPYNMFINQDYYKLKNSTNKEDKAFFELLEIIKKYNLKWQEDIDEPSQRLMHELARYRPSNYEIAVTKEKESNRLFSKFDRWKENFLDNFRSNPEDFEDNLNYDNAFKFTVAEHNLNFERNNIPISGIYKMDVNETSMDIIGSLLKFRLGILEHKALKDTSPIADAIKDLINNFDETKINDLRKKYTTNQLMALGYTDDDKKKFGKSNRQAIVNALYEINWEGRRVKKDSKGWATTDKLINSILKSASHSFFSLDPVSGFKNYFGAQFQLRQEALFNNSGLVSYKGALAGEAWALNTMRLISQEVYTRDPNHINIQLTDLFDFAQGRFNEKFSDNVTRDIFKDIYSLSWTTSQRKWLELLASMEFFSAAMHTVKVDRKVGDQVEVLNYIDAWEIDPKTNDIKLKSGIDKKYAPGGSEFNRIKNAIHEYQNFNQGAYAAAEQGAISQYVLARPIFSMRRFFPKMLMRRFYADRRMQKSGIFKTKRFDFKNLEEHWNPALQRFEMGYWARSSRMIHRLISKEHPQYKPTKEDWFAVGRTISDPIKAKLWLWMWLTIFGIDWDPEDPDKWKKIRERSSAMPGPWTIDDASKNYNFGGWLQNQALLVALNTDVENRFFQNPREWIRMFKDLSISSQAVENLSNVVSLTAGGLMGSEKAFYKRDSGYTTYRQAGAWKGERVLYKIVGFKADKLFDPEQATRDLWGAINR